MRSFWQKLFGQAYSVRRASTLLAITALASNVLGLLRNVIFYRLINPAQLDIYYASFRIPDLIFNLLILGAVSSAFIPVLSEAMRDKVDDDQHWRVLTDQVLSWLTLILGALAIVLVLLMPWIMREVVGGFSPERLAASITLSRILLIQSIFLAWSFCFGGLLNSFNRFTTYALAPLVYNIILIFGGVVAARYGINALGWAVVIGALGHCGIQYMEARRLSYRPRFNLARTKELREILRLMVPRSLSLGTSQIVTIFYTALASGLTAGSIAIFSGMNDLQTTPTVIVANSLAVAFFPTLTKQVANGKWDELNHLLLKTLRTALFLLLPMLVLSLVLRAQIVRLYFGIGGANWTLTDLAISTFVAFMLGIIPASIVALLARVFYACKDTRTPLIISAIAGLTGIIFAYVGIRVFGGSVAVLALSTTLVSLVQCICFIAMLYKKPELVLRLKPLFAPSSPDS